ncbi:unnamed protein product [Calypogeia fissa]
MFSYDLVPSFIPKHIMDDLDPNFHWSEGNEGEAGTKETPENSPIMKMVLDMLRRSIECLGSSSTGRGDRLCGAALFQIASR